MNMKLNLWKKKGNAVPADKNGKFEDPLTAKPKNFEDPLTAKPKKFKGQLTTQPDSSQKDE